jgi:hypothetical protein
MKTFKEFLIEIKACDEAKIWADDNPIETVIETCHRGDWLLWLAKRIDIPIKPLTLAKARCAKTVIHLMKDPRSINAVNLAERFGLTDEVTLDDLQIAADAAHTAAVNAYIGNSGYSAVAAAYAAAAAAYSGNSAYSAYAPASNAAYAAAVKDGYIDVKNQQKTADICREILGDLIIQKVKELCN